MLYSPIMLEVLGGILRPHGHKSWVAWTISGLFIVVVVAIGVYHRRSRL
jgi:hypothetical protein